MLWLGVPSRVMRRVLCCGAAFACLAPWPARANLPPPAGAGSELRDECLKAHEDAQVLRLDAKLVETKQALAACVVEGCPNAVRADCTEWMSQVVAATPSVVFAASSERGDETDVRVLMDGAELTLRLDGKAIELNPGPHTFRFELAPYPGIEQEVVLREGERERALAVRFGSAAAEPPPPPARAPISLPSEPPPPRPVPWVSVALGGVTLAAVASATTFGLIALNERRDKLDSCAPLCTDRQKRDVERPALAADISVAIALASGAAAIYTYWTRPELARPRTALKAPRLSCAVGAGASFLRYRGDF